MSQKVILLKLKDLVLWTENPRDPIDETATDQDIVDRALANKKSTWNLTQLAKNMGRHYDFSELPTVVFHGNKPVVYDGNRRMVLGKIHHGHVSVKDFDTSVLPTFPDEIPCNVCSAAIALENVWRKHAETGSWRPLERDIFLHKHMGEKKSVFLLMDETTGIVSANDHLNQRFVKDEVLREENLNKLGISFIDGTLHSKHSHTETTELLDDISRKVATKVITTRKNRGNVLGSLDPDSQQVVEKNKKQKAKPVALDRVEEKDSKVKSAPRQSKRVQKKATPFFGGTLYLRNGDVSNLYRDISDLHAFHEKNKAALSNVFPVLIRMALRLLCETAAKECQQDLASYVRSGFQEAKSCLDQDTKTTLSNYNVTANSLVRLLHTGAHNYTASADAQQTLAISIILGAILTRSHGKAL